MRRRRIAFQIVILPLVALFLLGPLMSISALAQQKTVVVYRTWFDPKDTTPRAVAQTKIIEEFHRRNPTIEIQTELVPWQQMHVTVIRDAAAGKAPCLVRPSFDNIQQIVQAGALMSLNRFTAALSEAAKKDYLLGWEATVYDGQKMSFFLEHRGQVLLYRKDLFAKAGATPPKTWEEFAKTAKLLTTGDTWGTAIPLSAKGSASGLMQWLHPFVWGYGDEVFEKNGKAILSKGLILAMQYLQEGARTHKFLPPTTLSDDVETATDAFMAGRLAMLVLGSHRIQHVLQSKVLKGNLGIATIPSPDPNKPSPSAVSGWQIAMTKDCKTPEAGWKFIEHIVSPEMNLLNTKIGGELPTRRSTLADPWFQTPEAEYVRFTANYFGEASKPQVTPPTYTVYTDLLSAAAQRIVGQGAAIEPTLQEAVTRYNSQVR